MSLLWYCLTDRGKINLCKAAHKLGIDVKKLEAEMEQRDREINKPRLDFEPAVLTHLEETEEIDKIMRKRPHGRPIK